MSLSGCGFQLRGSRAFALPFKKVYVESQNADQISQSLKQQLDFIKVKQVKEVSKAEAIIKLTNERFNRRTLSVDPRTGKVREYELEYAVDYQIDRPNGPSYLTHDTIALLRNYVFDQNAAISEFEEEQTLRNEMRQDVADSLLRRLEILRSK